MSRYPLAIMVLLLGLAYGVGWLCPIPLGFGSLGRICGWALLLGGAALLGMAADRFRRKGTTVNPTKQPDQLVTDGLYRISRNPMYLGMLMILLGVPLVQASLLGLLSPILFFLWMDRTIIPREEQVIGRFFGEPYQRYKMMTRRWL